MVWNGRLHPIYEVDSLNVDASAGWSGFTDKDNLLPQKARRATRLPLFQSPPCDRIRARACPQAAPQKARTTLLNAAVRHVLAFRWRGDRPLGGKISAIGCLC